MSKSSLKIQMNDVFKSFGTKDVLKGVNLDIERGKSTVIIGGSGSGKSVTIKTILGIIQPDQGDILIDGKSVVNQSKREQQELMSKIGMLFQGGALFDSMTIWENVSFGLREGKGMKDDEAYEIAIEKLKAVGLKEQIAQQYPAELSGGMQKRVSLARAISTNPEIIFFDEPTTGLDPIMSDVINDLIREVVTDIGATAVSITHDMASVRKIADSVAMLYNGEMIWHGHVDRLEKSGNDYVDQFINGRADGPVQF